MAFSTFVKSLLIFAAIAFLFKAVAPAPEENENLPSMQEICGKLFSSPLADKILGTEAKSLNIYHAVEKGIGDMCWTDEANEKSIVFHRNCPSIARANLEKDIFSYIEAPVESDHVLVAGSGGIFATITEGVLGDGGLFTFYQDGEQCGYSTKIETHYPEVRQEMSEDLLLVRSQIVDLVRAAGPTVR